MRRVSPSPITRGPVARLLVAVLALLALAGPAPALAQSGGGKPSAGELWRQYPLQPKGAATTAPPASTTPRTAAPVRTAAASRPARHDTGSSNGALLVVLTVLALLTLAAAGGAATLVVLHRRRGRPEPEPDVEPQPAVEPAPARRGRPASAVSLFADPPQETPVTQPDTPLAAAPPPETTLPPDPAVPWTAEIAWQQAEGRCRFCVVAVAGDDDEPVPVARSAWLGWPPSESSPVSMLGEAVQGLEHALATTGWSPLEPGPAWYAKRFAWTAVAEPEALEAPAPVIPLPASADAMEIEAFEPPRRFVRAEQWPEGSEERWRCEIHWDAGYVSSRFQAMAMPPGRRKGRAVGESAPFKWLLMSDPDPRTAEHDAAVSSLEEALLDAGWERAGRGAEWYAERFVWRRAGEPPAAVGPELSEAGRHT